MSHSRLLQRVPSAQFVSVALLAKHDLRFHKAGRDGSAKCDAYYTGDRNDWIVGATFRIASGEKAGLDRVEGLGQGYEEKSVTLSHPDGMVFEAFTYYATLIDESLRPYHWYKEHVLRGCFENSLPGEYIESIHAVSSVDDLNPLRAAQELAIYR